MNPEMEPVGRGRPIEGGAERRRSARSMVPEAEVGAIRDRWDQIKASFVDDPRGAVRQADRLVGDTVEVINQAVARMRARLGTRTSESDAGTTEDLRQALQQYQGLIERFLG